METKIISIFVLLITITCKNHLQILMPGTVAPSPCGDCDKPSVSGFNFMKEIKLTQGKFALVDDDDFEWLSQFKWHAAKNGYTFYARRTDSTPMHRLILSAPKGLLVDHKDRDGLNNQRNNIRVCTHRQNNCNTSGHRVKKYSKHLGVSIDTTHFQKRWKASISVNNKVRRIGHYYTEIEAAIAYNEAAIKEHGEFANLNIIP